MYKEMPTNTIYTNYSKNKGQRLLNGLIILEDLFKSRVKNDFSTIFISIFFILFIYSFLRPFKSYIARWFLNVGSILGILSILGVEYTQLIAEFLGIGRAADLYLYLSLVTIFLFVGFTINRFDTINKKFQYS